MGRVLLLLGVLLPLLEASVSAEGLREGLDAIFADQGLRGVRMSLRVVSITTRQVLYSYHADDLLTPASNVKLVTTAAALFYLGADYQFRTVVAATGDVDAQGVLQGDLVVVGGGDPSISGRFFGGDARVVFAQWADKLRDRGIGSVAGDLIGDDRFFDREYRHPGWPKGQEASWYEAPIGALSLNDNCVDFVLSPASPGQPARLSLNPPSDYLQFENRCMTRAGRGSSVVTCVRAPGSRRVLLRGSLPQNGGTAASNVTVDNPGEFFLEVLAGVLRERGIEVRGRVRLVAADETFAHLTPLLEHRSGLRDAIEVANKRSQNFYAEQILKTLGRETLGEGSFGRGVEAVTMFLEKQEFNPEHYRLADGSGLSRDNQLSAHFLTDLLAVMAHSPVADVYRESLAEAGVDGSMRNRLRDVNSGAKVFGKTGSLATVRALSGYVQAESGELLAYSFLMNGSAAGTWRARSVQDEALKLLADY